MASSANYWYGSLDFNPNLLEVLVSETLHLLDYKVKMFLVPDAIGHVVEAREEAHRQIHVERAVDPSDRARVPVTGEHGFRLPRQFRDDRGGRLVMERQDPRPALRQLGEVGADLLVLHFVVEAYFVRACAS